MGAKDLTGSGYGVSEERTSIHPPSGDVCRTTLQVAGEAVIRMPVSLRSLRLR